MIDLFHELALGEHDLVSMTGSTHRIELTRDVWDKLSSMHATGTRFDVRYGLHRAGEVCGMGYGNGKLRVVFSVYTGIVDFAPEVVLVVDPDPKVSWDNVLRPAMFISRELLVRRNLRGLRVVLRPDPTAETLKGKMREALRRITDSL